MFALHCRGSRFFFFSFFLTSGGSSSLSPSVSHSVPSSAAASSARACRLALDVLVPSERIFPAQAPPVVHSHPLHSSFAW